MCLVNLCCTENTRTEYLFSVFSISPIIIFLGKIVQLQMPSCEFLQPPMTFFILFFLPCYTSLISTFGTLHFISLSKIAISLQPLICNIVENYQPFCALPSTNKNSIVALLPYIIIQHTCIPCTPFPSQFYIIATQANPRASLRLLLYNMQLVLALFPYLPFPSSMPSFASLSALLLHHITAILLLTMIFYFFYPIQSTIFLMYTPIYVYLLLIANHLPYAQYLLFIFDCCAEF